MDLLTDSLAPVCLLRKTVYRLVQSVVGAWGGTLKRALLAIEQKQNKLVTYDTPNEDDVEFGIQLGSNGIVHILFEPIDPANATHPAALLEHLSTERESAIVVTLFNIDRKQ